MALVRPSTADLAEMYEALDRYPPSCAATEVKVTMRPCASGAVSRRRR